MMLQTLEKFLNFRHFEAAETIPIIVKQPELFIGSLDEKKTLKALSGIEISGFEQRIEFIVDFLNKHTLEKYCSSMFFEYEAHPDTIASVDLVSYGTKMERGKCVYTELISTANLRFMQGEQSPTSPCIDFFIPKGRSRNRMIISLLSNNILHKFNAYLFMLRHENKDKAWQFILTLKDNSNYSKPCLIETQVFKLDTSSSEHKFITIEKAKSK